MKKDLLIDKRYKTEPIQCPVKSNRGIWCNLYEKDRCYDCPVIVGSKQS